MQIPALFSLEGRTALVTGASRGLGRAIALGLAAAGADLVLAARDEQKLAEVRDEVVALGRSARISTFELADAGSVERSCQALLDGGVEVDVLVNNGAISDWADLDATTLDRWRHMFEVNVTSMYLLCRAFAPRMKQRKWGRIINFGSYVSKTGRPNLSAYVASKHAVLGLTRAVAAELAPSGATCNAVAPGFFDTDMAAPTVGHPQRAKIFRDAIAMGRFGDPAEIVGPVLFLASPAASYVTGQMLHVDGGVDGVLSLPVVVET